MSKPSQYYLHFFGGVALGINHDAKSVEEVWHTIFDKEEGDLEGDDKWSSIPGAVMFRHSALVAISAPTPAQLEEAAQRQEFEKAALEAAKHAAKSMKPEEWEGQE